MLQRMGGQRTIWSSTFQPAWHVVLYLNELIAMVIAQHFFAFPDSTWKYWWLQWQWPGDNVRLCNSTAFQQMHRWGKGYAQQRRTQPEELVVFHYKDNSDVNCLLLWTAAILIKVASAEVLLANKISWKVLIWRELCFGILWQYLSKKNRAGLLAFWLSPWKWIFGSQNSIATANLNSIPTGGWIFLHLLVKMKFNMLKKKLHLRWFLQNYELVLVVVTPCSADT